MQSIKTFVLNKIIFDKWMILSACLLMIYACQTLFYMYFGSSSTGIAVIFSLVILILLKSVFDFYVDNVGIVVIYFITAFLVVSHILDQFPYVLESVYFISNEVASKNIADLAKLATIFQMVGESTSFKVDITQNYNVLHSHLIAVQNIEAGNKDVYLQMSYQINQFDSAASQMYVDIISMETYLKENNSFIYSMVGGELNSLLKSLKGISLVDNNGLSFMNNWCVLTLLLMVEVLFTLLAFYVLIKDKVSF
jgi:hypothetical protein